MFEFTLRPCIPPLGFQTGDSGGTKGFGHACFNTARSDVLYLVYDELPLWSKRPYLDSQKLQKGSLE